MRLFTPISAIDLQSPSTKKKKRWKGLGDDGMEQLTDRELEVLELIVEGLSSKMIAQRLNLSLDTVETHRRNLIRKTKSGNMVEVVVKGFRKGWVR